MTSHRDRAGLALVAIVFAASIWVVSSVMRGKGVLVAVGAVLAMAAAIRSARAGRRTFLQHLVFGALLAASGVLLLEALLRAFPSVLSGAAANAALGGYHGEGDGIYEFDPYVGSIMRARYRRPMFWNGHTWRHETNDLGFRGPSVDRADAVFLGDSMIYGHGVEDEETVPARFAQATGLSRANLGLQGTSPVQALELFRRMRVGLRPRYVFLCVHPNDVSDPLSVYGIAELERFAAQEGYRPVVRTPGTQVFDLWMKHVALPLRMARVAHAVAYRLAGGTAGAALPEPEEGIPRAVFVESELGWAVFRQAVREIARESRNAGARLVVFDLGYPPAFTSAVERLARDLGVQYADAGRLAMSRAREGDHVYLRNDGHWSRAGAEIVALALARAVGCLDDSRKLANLAGALRAAPADSPRAAGCDTPPPAPPE